MATTAELQIDPEGGNVRIHDLSVTDPELVDYLGEYDGQARTEALVRALKVGATTIQLADTSREVEFVKREFDTLREAFEDEIEDVRDELQEKFGDDGEVSEILGDHLGEDGRLQEQLDDALGEEGQFEERLDDVLGEDGQAIQDALDLDKDGTPTSRLDSRMQAEFRSVHEKLDRQEGREEAKQRSWEKGEEFEGTVGNLLANITYGTNDEVEHTGDSEGDIPGRDVGDHVVTMGETDQRVVVEAKSESGYSQPDVKEEMADAIENRAADYGIFVTQCEAYVPDKIGYFQEFDGKFLVVALSEDEDDNLEPGFLEIAYNWARMRALQDWVDSGESLDPETISARVDSIRDTISRFSEAKKKCTSIESTATDVKGLLDDLRDDVTDDLNEIVTELTKAETS